MGGVINNAWNGGQCSGKGPTDEAGSAGGFQGRMSRLGHRERSGGRRKGGSWSGVSLGQSESKEEEGRSTDFPWLQKRCEFSLERT